MFLLALWILVSNGASVDEWKSRTVYQLLTDRFQRPDGSTEPCDDLSNYCGGTLSALAANLDYIQGMGFDAIWISPVVDNTDGGYHGYWAQDWYSVNPHHGSSDDLKNLVSTAHSKGMFVMLDVVANHVGPVGMDFSSINPFNQNYHYHDRCQITDFNNYTMVKYCRLADLPDLDQNNTWVASTLQNWVKDIVSTYGFDGIRIDTVPEVNTDFWSAYGEAAGVFQMGEVFNGDPAYVGPFQGPLTAVFNYPMFWTIRDVFKNGEPMSNINQRYEQEQQNFQDLDALGLFVDNHDNPRFLHNFGDISKFKNAITFSLTGQGIPFYYYGSEQAYGGGNDPQNREQLWTNFDTSSEMYQFTKSVIMARKTSTIWSYNTTTHTVNDSHLVYSRGPLLIALTNSNWTVQATCDYETLQNYLTFTNEDKQICNILEEDDCLDIEFPINITLNREPKIYLPQVLFEAVRRHSVEYPQS